MKKLVVAIAAGLAMLAAGTELVRAQDGGEVITYTKPLIIPWETRETGFAAPTDVAKRLVRQLHYTQIISRYAAEYDVPVELAQAVVQIESNFRPTAKGKAGEIGLMQIKPATARQMGYEGPDYGLYDPETNIRFAMKYLAGAHERGGGKICGTILKYNAGHAAKRMNPVSQRYCNRVQAVMAAAEPPAVVLPVVREAHASGVLMSAPLVF
jgi:soluble lytic murein transglycosylase-like protein